MDDSKYLNLSGKVNDLKYNKYFFTQSKISKNNVKNIVSFIFIISIVNNIVITL